MSSLIVQKAGEIVRVLDEIVIRRATTQDACEEFLRRYPKHLAGVTVYGDASGYQQQTTGATDYQLIKEFFQQRTSMPVQYKVPKSNPNIRERVTLSNARLRSASGNIGVFVDRRCKELVKDFEQVSYKTDTYQIDKDRDRLRTHLSDAFGYLLWQEYKPTSRIGERGERLL